MCRLLFPVAAWVLSAGLVHAGEVRVIIEFAGQADAGVVRAQGGVVLGEFHFTAAIVAQIPAQALRGILRNPNIISVQEDGILSVEGAARGGKGSSSGTSTGQKLVWGVDRVDAEKVWSVSRGRNIQIHINDSGIDNLHPDFKDANGNSRVVLGPNFNNPLKSSLDDHGHGTHCAGIAGASDNTIGCVGVANECTLTAVKTLDQNATGWLSDFAEGIEWSVTHGAHVISMSLVSTSNSSTLQNACTAAVAAGVVVVAAAGNWAQSGNPVSYPGAYSSVICVASTDSNNVRASSSTYGTQVDIAAPGVSIYSTTKSGGYSTMSGTSMATPHVAGAAALAMASGRYTDTNGNGRINDEIRAALEGTADDLGAAGYDVYYGRGLLDAEEATTGFVTP